MALFIGRGLKGDNKLNQNLHTLFPRRSTAPTPESRSDPSFAGKVGRETGCHRRILMMNELDCLGPVQGLKVASLSSNLKGLMFPLRRIWKSLFVPCASVMCVPSHNVTFDSASQASSFLNNKYPLVFEKNERGHCEGVSRLLDSKNHLFAALFKSFSGSSPSCAPPDKDNIQNWHLSLLCYQIYRYWSLFPLLHVSSQTSVLLFSVPFIKQAGSCVTFLLPGLWHTATTLGTGWKSVSVSTHSQYLYRDGRRTLEV